VDAAEFVVGRPGFPGAGITPTNDNAMYDRSAAPPREESALIRLTVATLSGPRGGVRRTDFGTRPDA
jgi:hypothetical protein